MSYLQINETSTTESETYYACFRNAMYRILLLISIWNVFFAEMAESFKAKDVGLRAQKKILSRMANKTVAKVFIDETTGSLLDNVYRLTKA